MKPNKYIKNTNYATIAEMGTLDLSITVPANVNANAFVENITTVAFNKPIYRVSLYGGQDAGGNWVTIVDDNAYIIKRDRQYPTTLTGSVTIGVYLKGENQIAIYYMSGSRDLIGDSSNTITAHITMFQSPFEA